MTEQGNKPASIDAQPTANDDASAAQDTKSAEAPPEPRPVPEEARKATPKRKLLAAVLGLAVLALLLVFGIPWVKEMLDTVSTDDAFVNGHDSTGQSSSSPGPMCRARRSISGRRS